MLMVVNRKIYYISMGCTKSQFVCLPGLLYFYIEIFPTYLKTNESNERFAIPFMRNHFYLQFCSNCDSSYIMELSLRKDGVSYV